MEGGSKMKREEQIMQYCAEQGFPYGACSSISSIKALVATEAIKWADKTMIEKACNWLEVQLDRFKIGDNKIKVDFVDKEKFIDLFKKTMEE
jgi:hypothetical protein